jgi:predicted PurR-regulated permease PerM
LLVFFLVPFVFGLAQILQNTQRLLTLARSLDGLELPAAPAWLAALPIVGEPLGAAWNDAVQLGSSELAVKVAPFAGNIARWLLAELGGLTYVLVQGLVTIGLCALLYVQGETAVSQAFAAGRRLGGAQGERLVRLAGQAIRGVALGVGMTALAQSLLACLGLAAAGIPYTALLTAITFVACVAQIGPLIVLVPAAVWLYWQGHTGWAIALLAWSGVIATMDNVMRPLLIRRGAGDLPLLVIFAGVIGGLLTFGLVGLFVGPVCLAVTWTLLEAWLHESEDQAATRG